MIHTVKGFGIVNKAEIDIFLLFSCFFYDPTDVDNLISGSSALSNFQLEHLEVHDSHIAELIWRILRITWLASEMSAIVW